MKKKKEKKSSIHKIKILINETSEVVCTKRCNIKFKWRGWQKEHIRQVMIWQSWIQCIFGTFQFGKQQFTVVCSAIHVQNLLDVGDNIGEYSSRKCMVLVEMEDLASKLKSSESWTSMSSIYNWTDHSSQSIGKDEEKISKVGTYDFIIVYNKFRTFQGLVGCNTLSLGELDWGPHVAHSWRSHL